MLVALLTILFSPAEKQINEQIKSKGEKQILLWLKVLRGGVVHGKLVYG